MGHFVFIALHVIALLFGMVALIITIPAHMIYAAVRSKPGPPTAGAPSPLTHVRCPDCKELVLAEAVKCKHCGTALTPTDLSAVAAHQASSDSRSRLFAIGAVIVAMIILWNVVGGW